MSTKEERSKGVLALFTRSCYRRISHLNSWYLNGQRYFIILNDENVDHSELYSQIEIERRDFSILLLHNHKCEVCVSSNIIIADIVMYMIIQKYV